MNEPPARGDRRRSVILTGDLTIRTIEGVHTLIADALTQHDAVVIDCTEATAIDLSFVQLLLSARRSAARSGKSVALMRPAAGLLLEILARGGFLEAANADGQFWLESEQAA